MAVRKKDSAEVEDIYFIVKESHCLGHEEDQTQTVAEYRRDQGVDTYDDMNREWRDIILKKRSSGPTIGKPCERSLQLFDMCSYDMTVSGSSSPATAFATCSILMTTYAGNLIPMKTNC